MAQHDTTFVRDGRALHEWLVDLVSPNRDRRNAAGDAVMAMIHGLPSVHTDLNEVTDKIDHEDHSRLFHAEIKSAVARPDFPAKSFFPAAAARLIGGQAQWMSEITKSDAQYDAVLERIRIRLESTISGEKRQQELRRVARALCAEIKRVTNDGMPELDAFSMANVVLWQVIEHAGERMLESPEAIWMLLENSSTRGLALKALEQIGPPAAPLFLEYLVDRVRQDSSPWSPELAASISVGRGSTEQVVRALERIRAAIEEAAEIRELTPKEIDPNDPDFGSAYYQRGKVWAAVAVLRKLGPAVRSLPEVGPQIIPALLDLSRAKLPAYRGAAAAGLGEVARNADQDTAARVVDRLLGLTHDHLWVVGSAIDSLGTMAEFPDRVVPRLVELVDEFHDYDPDNFYYGDHYRVCAALARYGPAAAPAVPRLIRYLEEWLNEPAEGREPPKDVLRLLIAVGPKASDALPIMRKVAMALAEYEQGVVGDELPLTHQVMQAIAPEHMS